MFQVAQVNLNTYPITYTIKDYRGDTIKGAFYAEELQVVDKSDNIYPINKILNTRRRRGKIEYLVTFLGYPDRYWIPQQDLFDL